MKNSDVTNTTNSIPGYHNYACYRTVASGWHRHRRHPTQRHGGRGQHGFSTLTANTRSARPIPSWQVMHPVPKTLQQSKPDIIVLS
ncbi:hypothetical protein PT277_01615 [Acetobacteraceae bacterium ESL0709]|nr:hypothetical protein [Acetobacteraceae bacterium ESL0697]MDF7677399.1 hypothetical protein [Acetobacteraceae bacterium ESL0709]